MRHKDKNSVLMISNEGVTEEDMDTVRAEMSIESKRSCKQLPWFFGAGFLMAWLALFYAIVIPLSHSLPNGLKIAQEIEKPGEFVAERAEILLFEIDRMGPRVTGDVANEVVIYDFLLNEIEKIRSQMVTDLFELEVDVQHVSGSYMRDQLMNVYRGVQNVIVKLSAKNSNSTSYLLLNSHTDTKPGAWGAGDDAFMVVVMLEVLRQMSISEKTFLHPIVFLFNGAEEQSLLAAHGFITQHKWAANCKTVINLEGAGAGGREILFQSGPNHPWLMRHYRNSVKHPFATTLAEEIFQAGLIPSDTDFRIFRDYGPVPGLDLATVKNGFVYHTKFDRWGLISRDSLQNSGDNILALTRSICNAEEMYDTEAYSQGHSVFFDFLGLFFIYYYESTGVALNMSFSLGGILVVCVSLWRMSRVSCERVSTLACEFGIFLLLAVLGFLLAFGFPLLMSVFYDAGDRTMTYFSNSWLLIGIFICPSLIGLVLPSTLYLTLRPQEKICHAYRLQIAQHGHCVILSVICIILTIASFRSTYLCMISIFFYFGSQVINLLSTLHDRGYLWALIIGAGQIMPFLYLSYRFYGIISIVIPMTGRNGLSPNPDMLVALLCALGSILSFGFLAPLINAFRRPNCLIGGLVLTMFIFCMITLSHIGFPYRSKTNVMRVDSMQVNRRFYDFDGNLSLEDSGYYLHLLDRHKEQPLHQTMNLTNLQRMGDTCGDELMCGIPCYRWCASRNEARWLPRWEPVELPYPTVLKLINKTVLDNGYRVRYFFQLSGPPNLGLFVKPKLGVKLLKWSFDQKMLDYAGTYKPPLQILITYGKDSSPIDFYFELLKSDDNLDMPVFELGVSGHYASPTARRDNSSLEFLKTLPDFAYSMEWPSSYERHIF
ncbi:endoplasmic reticulum metallopeptidase 1-like [Drosophila tropicalis]|uniref:endoplasmic reticulum metallopeptidase 1-like n=1 Tax=Drosophila tropicalis TaxID=46794 RepID=UPI0035AB9A1F